MKEEPGVVLQPNLPQWIVAMRAAAQAKIKQSDIEEIVENQLAAAKTRLAQIEAVLERRVEIEKGWAELQKARADDAAWNARFLRHTQVQEHMNRVRLAVSQARLAVEAEQRRLSDRAVELGRKVTAGREQAAILAQARAALSHLDELQARRDALAVELRATAERSAEGRGPGGQG